MDTDDAMLAEAEQTAQAEAQSESANQKQPSQQQQEPTRRQAELLDTSFEDRRYPFMVTRETVLDYFSRSPFYDKKCNNEIVREQNKPLESMKMMTGLEYVTYPNKHEPRLFVIIKQMRSSETLAARKAIYYVLDRVIYQAPSVRHVCLRRLRSACENIKEAVQFYEKNKAFSCVEGRVWAFPSDTNRIWRQSAQAMRSKQGEDRQNVKRFRRITSAVQKAMQSVLQDGEEDSGKS